MKTTVFLWGRESLYENYRAALQRCGCEVCLSHDPAESRRCAGLLLPGGGDIFGRLDREEHLLIRSFVGTGRPILGICRGMQALNVWFGGTLHDFIPGHQTAQGDMVHPTRTADLMERLLGSAPAVTSNHHQAVAALGRDLTAMQWAHDGTVEAIRHRSLPIWGVQWHPERQSYAMRRGDAADAAPLFDCFLLQMHRAHRAQP